VSAAISERSFALLVLFGGIIAPSHLLNCVHECSAKLQEFTFIGCVKLYSVQSDLLAPINNTETTYSDDPCPKK
jgi:hypothetical protein